MRLPPKDPLDLCIRLFLLGAATPREVVEELFDDSLIQCLSRLNVLVSCPAAPEWCVSTVALSPLSLAPAGAAEEAAHGVCARARVHALLCVG